MWNVRLKVNCGCKYVTEQTLYDINHENRIERWMEKFTMKFKPNESGGENAKVDGKKLP